MIVIFMIVWWLKWCSIMIVFEGFWGILIVWIDLRLWNILGNIRFIWIYVRNLNICIKFIK